METKSTPGPWIAYGKYVLDAVNKDAPSIATVTELHGGSEKMQIQFENDAKQTARFIAKAPNMLEALEQIASDKPNSDKFALMAIARAAIQAATGK